MSCDIWLFLTNTGLKSVRFVVFLENLPVLLADRSPRVRIEPEI